MADSVTDWAAWVGAITGLLALYQNSAQRRDQRKIQRPFIGIEGAILTLDGNMLSARISFVNYGQSLASNLCYEMSAAISERQPSNPSSLNLNFLPTTSQNLPPVGIGGKFFMQSMVVLTAGQPEKFLGHQLMLFLEGKLYYEDTFGNKYEEKLELIQGTPTGKKDTWNLGGGVARGDQF